MYIEKPLNEGLSPKFHLQSGKCADTQQRNSQASARKVDYTATCLAVHSTVKHNSVAPGRYSLPARRWRGAGGGRGTALGEAFLISRRLDPHPPTWTPPGPPTRKQKHVVVTTVTRWLQPRTRSVRSQRCRLRDPRGHPSANNALHRASRPVRRPVIVFHSSDSTPSQQGQQTAHKAERVAWLHATPPASTGCQPNRAWLELKVCDLLDTFPMACVGCEGCVGKFMCSSRS